MPAIEDHDYLKICAELASLLSISLSSARRKVELQATKEGVRDMILKKKIAERLLKQARSDDSKTDESAAAQLDQLLTALAEEENFMVED